MKPAAVALTASLLLASGSATAQEFPNRAIRLVVPLAPGGSGDIFTRLVAREMEKQLQQSIVIDNQAGGGGIVGTGQVARATPDGYTAVMAGLGPLLIAPALQKQPPYSLDDFAGIGFMWDTSLVLVARGDSTIRSVKDLVAQANANPGKLTYSHAGVGGIGRLSLELLKQEAGIDVLAVAYKGQAPADGEARLRCGFVDPAGLRRLPAARTREMGAPGTKAGSQARLVVALRSSRSFVSSSYMRR